MPEAALKWMSTATRPPSTALVLGQWSNTEPFMNMQTTGARAKYEMFTSLKY